MVLRFDSPPAKLPEIQTVAQTPVGTHVSASTTELAQAQGDKLQHMSSCTPAPASESGGGLKGNFDSTYLGGIMYNGIARSVEFGEIFPESHVEGAVPMSPPTTIHSEPYHEANTDVSQEFYEVFTPC